MSIAYNPLSGNLELKEPGPQGPAGVVSAAGPGSQGAPSISFAADLNTGIYSPGADQVAVSTGGAQRITVDASGRLLVGTPSDFSGSTNGLLQATSGGGARAL